MRRKKAIVTVELVDESARESNERIVQELIEWLRKDAVSIPWVKEVKKITVKDE